jgi:hypothetical protein
MGLCRRFFTPEEMNHIEESRGGASTRNVQLKRVDGGAYPHNSAEEELRDDPKVLGLVRFVKSGERLSSPTRGGTPSNRKALEDLSENF